MKNTLTLASTPYRALARTARLPLCLLAAIILQSCAMAPTGGEAPAQAPAAASATTDGPGIQAAYDLYSRRDFAGAADAYDALLTEAGSAEQTRLAQLGKALLFLSTDPQWRDMEKAAASLQAAEAVEGDPANPETAMLMNALSSLIGVEANISELNTKVSNATVEIARLKAQREALEAEQAALNEALEKLKELTIGS